MIGPQLKISYLVREPVSRTVSHHYHDLRAGIIDECDDDVVVRSHPALIDNSRYAMQIRRQLDETVRHRFAVT